ncbi:MAG: Protein of unknown function (DUF722) [Bacteriophage sp.]|nr:MAG: Protein of unknown function (DUF722) [Bacteriophage sp.]
MSIKEEYIERVKYDLKTIRKNLIKMNAWEIEIGVLEEKINAYKNGGLALGIQSSSTITIDDIVDRDETRLNTLRSNIEHTKYKLKEYEACLECLNDNEYAVINNKYLKNVNKSNSDEQIAEKLNCSHTTIRRWRNSAILKIAKYKHENIEIA